MTTLTPADLQTLAGMGSPVSPIARNFGQNIQRPPVPQTSPMPAIPQGSALIGALKNLGYTVPPPGQPSPGGMNVSRETRGATQGPPMGSTEGQAALSDFARANVAAQPSIKDALSMTGMVAGTAAGPIGIALHGILGSVLQDSPGPMLSPDAMARVMNEGQQVMVASPNVTPQVTNQAKLRMTAALQVERALSSGSQIGGAGPGLSAGTGVDRLGRSYASNIGGAGVSHGLAGGAAPAGAGGTYGGGGDPGAQGAGRNPAGPRGSW